MIQRIKRILVWLRRWKHCRGFGVQSPWAYRFIRYVVNEHYPYYAYEELKDQLPSLDEHTRKLCEFYFRMANYMQAPIILDYVPDTDAYATYMKAGAHKSEIRKIHQDDLNRDYVNLFDQVKLVRFQLNNDYQTFFDTVLKYVRQDAAVIVQGIHQSKDTKRFWKNVVNDPRCVTTFDLYYCGIIFFDKTRYKEKYIVNF